MLELMKNFDKTDEDLKTLLKRLYQFDLKGLGNTQYVKNILAREKYFKRNIGDFRNDALRDEKIENVTQKDKIVKTSFDTKKRFSQYI
jgi:hypothetical protein